MQREDNDSSHIHAKTLSSHDHANQHYTHMQKLLRNCRWWWGYIFYLTWNMLDVGLIAVDFPIVLDSNWV